MHNYPVFNTPAFKTPETTIPCPGTIKLSLTSKINESVDFLISLFFLFLSFNKPIYYFNISNPVPSLLEILKTGQIKLPLRFLPHI